MKSIKAIFLFGIVLAIIDAAMMLILKITDTITGQMFNELLVQSLSVIGIITVASLLIAFIVKLILGR